MSSIVNTLKAHANPKRYDREWMIPNLEFLKAHLTSNIHIMQRHYGDMCLMAKASSSSTGTGISYRDYVMQHTLDDVIKIMENGIDHFIYAGTRLDRRGKFRLICAFHAAFRILDFLINNGSYALCEHKGILSQYTTEGYSGAEMWQAMYTMSNRDGMTMICLDYKGYDTQLSLEDYLDISYLLNEHRIKQDEDFAHMYDLYSTWMKQPKPLVTRLESGVGVNILLDYYQTLASGLHGTHSFENLIGISTYLQSIKLGIKSYGFWSNGDDQNISVNNAHVEPFVSFSESNFEISWKKSLIGHVLAVWGKMWFSRTFHPFWEIGTFRSIWEKEGGDVDYVEDSKLKANYTKILQVAITLIRLKKSDDVVTKWINMLCNEVDINPNIIPVELTKTNVTSASNTIIKPKPYGLISSKAELMNRSFPLTLFNVNNYFDMINSMYNDNTFFTEEPQNVRYYNERKTFVINAGYDYSSTSHTDIPWVLSKIVSIKKDTLENIFVRDVLQGTKSYDGIASRDYYFNDMLSLAHSINNRNRDVWMTMHKR
jgi:hypothetical protein